MALFSQYTLCHLACAGLVWALSAQPALAQNSTASLAYWTDVVRTKTFDESQGVYDNMMNVRRWILMRSGHCTERNRHVIFDMRGNVLTYLDDADNALQTQLNINQSRQALVQQGSALAWVEGNSQTVGYPFAISCHQPHVDLPRAIARYLGEAPEGRLSGNWNGIKVGTPQKPMSIHEVLQTVYKKRVQQKRITLPASLLPDLTGMLIIESGGVREAKSKANARGILQLPPSALKDCSVPINKQLHSIAQVDCALWLLERNHCMLQPVFAATFYHLPEDKQEQLYRLLLLQAYHGGPGRVKSLLLDTELNAPATYFAANHQNFSAGDIAFGKMFHNLGRNRLGFASLYYTADIRIAQQLLQSKNSASLFPG
ncbi:transglycosylase SLT domain-containing protein [Rheinheimera sp. UJ51]|uniref:transglycosylase SLT domain-containing protein n=1 Tax=Rheinheimera sp. UJ51 TaxID=2892446 RepID=UPI001E628530|nr:transglycosylase SLT domain-containing protein [Rheinheimera sp. UJ51]MCC5451221.1 transglycosylase SLT domain-containing protein [Rheinheimera sp. UJ51]